MGATTFTQNYRAAVSGGTDKINYYISYGYLEDDGAMVYSGSSKHSIAGNIRGQINSRLSVTVASPTILKKSSARYCDNGTNDAAVTQMHVLISLRRFSNIDPL